MAINVEIAEKKKYPFFEKNEILQAPSTRTSALSTAHRRRTTFCHATFHCAISGKGFLPERGSVSPTYTSENVVTGTVFDLIPLS